MPNNFHFVVSDTQIESKAQIGKTLKLFQKFQKCLTFNDLKRTPLRLTHTYSNARPKAICELFLIRSAKFCGSHFMMRSN
jgi:hypothetical protein